MSLFCCNQCNKSDCLTFTPPFVVVEGKRASGSEHKVYTPNESKYIGKYYIFEHGHTFWFCYEARHWTGSSGNGGLFAEVYKTSYPKRDIEMVWEKFKERHLE